MDERPPIEVRIIIYANGDGVTVTDGIVLHPNEIELSMKPGHRSLTLTEVDYDYLSLMDRLSIAFDAPEEGAKDGHERGD